VAASGSDPEGGPEDEWKGGGQAQGDSGGKTVESEALGPVEMAGEPASSMAPPLVPEVFWNLPNTVTMLRILIVPVLLIATIVIHEDLALWLFVAGLLFALVRLWPMYTTRYLYRGEDDDPSLDARGWGEDLRTAWRLTGNRGAFLRSTVLAIGVGLAALWLYDWGRLNLSDDAQLYGSLFALVAILPLAHLVVCERAIALRDAAEIRWALGEEPDGAEDAMAGDDDLDDRIDAAIARTARSEEEAEHLRRFMDAVPRPLIEGGDALVDYARDQQEQSIEAKGAEDPVEFMRFGLRLDRTDWIEKALDGGVDIDAPVDNGQPALVLAAARAKPAALTLLLERGARIEARDRSGRTALWHAARAGALEVMDRLLAHGAEPALDDEHGVSPLFVALESDQIPAARRLVAAGVDLSRTRSRGEDALGRAADRGRLAVVRWLLAEGVPIDRRTGGDPRCGPMTPLARAVRAGHLEVARELVAHGADVHVEVKGGRNLLHLAAADANQPLCRWLIEEHGFDPLKTDGNGIDAVAYAEFQDRPQPELVRYLEEAGRRD